MSVERVVSHLSACGLADRITTHATSCDTVTHAAETIGCLEAEIAKTMTFLLSDGPIAIVCAGDARVKNGLYKAQFGEKAKMIPFEEVEGLIGHAPGGVCPFGLLPGVRVYLDESLRRFTTVHAAGGALEVTVRLSPAELETATNVSGWVDVCDGWRILT
jgi:prolyl-tRNA editing enzyme YbaK/EbsC (Cys-tRNA(Pro) deacylase)